MNLVAKMFDGNLYKTEFSERICSVEKLVLSTHTTITSTHDIEDVSRDARGLAILLLFAAYENLLTGLCNGLLEKAESLKIQNKKLKPGFQLFVIYPRLQSISELPINRIWTDKGRELLDVFHSSEFAAINKIFPNDGSFMKCSQVRLFCDLFDLGDPARILKEIWDRIDTVVTQRNKIAHGVDIPANIGKIYSKDELLRLINIWKLRWCEFIDYIQAKASNRNFYEI